MREKTLLFTSVNNYYFLGAPVDEEWLCAAVRFVPAKFASFARFRIMLSTPILPDILSMRMFLSADAEW